MRNTPLYTIDASAIAHAIAPLLVACATTARADIVAALESARERERSDSARHVLTQLIENARIAHSDEVAICQDTGVVWVRVEVDESVFLRGDVQGALDETVARVWESQGLRASIVGDALLDRTNTGDNTPVLLEIGRRVPTQDVAGATISVMLKGAGSDNASRVCMLDPSAGIAEIEEILIAHVKEKASLACPPLVIGLGVGSTFDNVASLSKRVLLRDVTRPNPVERLDALERRLLAAVNATGIGPAALGGDTTALRVHLKTAPSHIAALPLAINLGCCALRSRKTFIEAQEVGDGR